MAPTDPQQNASLDPFASAYATAFTNMDQGFCLLEKVDTLDDCPPDFRYQMVNPAFEKHTGLPDVIGKTIRQVVPQLEESALTLYEQVALTGQSVQVQTYVAQLDRWIEANVFRIRQQPPTQIAALFTNITDRKRAEEAQQVSEVKYRTLFETMEQGFGIGQILPADQHTGAPMDYQWLEVNPQFERLTGLARTDVLRYTTRQLIPGLEETWYEGYGHVAATGETVSFEAYSPVLSRWFEVYVFALGSPASRRVGVLFSNTTERKQQQKRQMLLLQLADALRPLTAAVDMMAAVTELVGRHYEVGRCGFARIPLPYDQLVIEQEWTSGVIPSRPESFPLSSLGDEPHQQFRLGQTLVDDGLADGRSQEDEEGAKPGGDPRSRIWVPLLKEGQWVGAFFVEDSQRRAWTQAEVGLLEDIAERSWAAVERARAEEALKEEYRHKDVFLAMLGHELRNPLAAITNTLLVLKLTKGQDESMPYAKGISILSRHSQHLNRMVDDLLDMSRIRQGIVRLQWEVVNLTQLLHLTVEAAQPLYQDQNRQLSLSLPAPPLYVRGDEARLSQVVMNLLTNGAKYTDPEGQVWVSLEQVEDQAIVRVRDNGIGLTNEERTGIFEVFVQGATSLDRPHGGLGLGLAVAKHLVEAHGGQIQALSRGIGQGSEFVIGLPLLSDLSSAVPTPHEEPLPTTGRVLVVDDNIDFADTTARLLRAKGFEVYTRYTGAQGLAGAESLRPDALLLDIGMAYLDGYEVCRQIRAQPWGGRIAIIALTGYGLDTDRQKAVQAGFDGHLLKPINLTTLAQVVAGAIDRKHSR